MEYDGIGEYGEYGGIWWNIGNMVEYREYGGICGIWVAAGASRSTAEHAENQENSTGCADKQFFGSLSTLRPFEKKIVFRNCLSKTIINH